MQKGIDIRNRVTLTYNALLLRKGAHGEVNNL